MKPGKEKNSLLIETLQEALETQAALFEFSWVEGTVGVLNKLDADLPIQLPPNEAVLALSALKIAADKWTSESASRGNVLNMLNQYETELKES